MDLLVRLWATAALASVHIFSAGLRFLSEIPRSRLLSISGGISIAYVILRAGGAGEVPYLKEHAYILVLLSILAF